MRKKNKVRKLVFIPIALLIIMVFSYQVITYMYNSYTLKEEAKNLKQEISNLKEKEKILQSEINRLQDPEYIARYARENYLYSKDGEYIIKLDKTKGLEIIDATKDYNEHLSYAFFIILSIILLIIFLRIFTKKKNKV